MILIGDLHGNFTQLGKILHDTEDEVICVGDVGVGFKGIGSRPYFRKNFKFIRGNHDKPEDCQNHPQYLGDYGIHKGIFFISGARSVDQHMRTEGLDWWRDEQLSHADLEKALAIYKEAKPEVVISHDCPWEIQEDICRDIRVAQPWTRKWGDPQLYPTIIAMDEMLAAHRPKIWVHGHWHFRWRLEKNGTRFICLDELETLDLEKEISTLLPNNKLNAGFLENNNGKVD